MWARSLGPEDPVTMGMAAQSRESHGQRSLEGYSPCGCKESAMTEVTKTHTGFPVSKMSCFLPVNDIAPVLL